MEDSSASTIETRIVYGFKGAGKTSYISDCIMNDFFHKYGKTLVLCFERGKEEYDTEALLERNTYIAYYDGQEETEAFCRAGIAAYRPDRIYAEMSAKLPDARKHFPDMMNVTSTVTLIEWETMDWYTAYFTQQVSQMVSESQQITFRGCPSKELLAPYSRQFRLMNSKASYLRQDPMGFHEKAFDLFLPYSLEEEKINISEDEYLVFWLDAADHPEHYDGKSLCFSDPLELRHVTDSCTWSAGRVVMTCCMADLQFMSFELTGTAAEDLTGGWITMEAAGNVIKGSYGQKELKLEMISGTYAPVPGSGGIMKASES